MLTQLQAMTL